VFGPEHAQLLARHGFSKQDVKNYLVEHAGRPAGMLRRTGRADVTNRAVGPAKVSGAILTAQRPDDDLMDDDELVTMLQSPEHIVVAVAGAANAGVTTVAHLLGFPSRTPGAAVVRR
jgi:hypothetical protein